MDYLPLSDNAARQIIDSTTMFFEHARVAEQAQQYKGGMYWKTEGEYEYLVKTHPDNPQTRLGRRTPETEKIHDKFSSRKQQLEERLPSYSHLPWVWCRNH